MSLLDFSQALDAIRAFNSDPETIATDRLMFDHFVGPISERTSVAERVVLLDKLWATQMFRQPGHVRKVIASLEQGEQKIIESVRSLDSEAIEKEPGRLIEIAKWAMPIALGHDTNCVARPKYQPYSFATKYLHWISHGRFPIVDSYARIAIHKLQRSHQLTQRIWAGQPDWASDYPRWIEFFGKHLYPTLTTAEREALKKADSGWQQVQPSQPNTLLRILDKVFYQLGKAMTEDRQPPRQQLNEP